MSDRLKDFALQIADEQLVAMRAEIARLRLTDEEREAVRAAIACCEDFCYGSAAQPDPAAILRKLLERLA